MAKSLFKKFRNIILSVNDCDMPKYRKTYDKSTAGRKARELTITKKANELNKG